MQLRRTCERGQNTTWGFGAVKVFWIATLDGEDNSSLSVPHIVHPHRRSGVALPTRVLPCRGYMCSLSVHLSREHVSSAALWQQPAQVRPLQDVPRNQNYKSSSIAANDHKSWLRCRKAGLGQARARAPEHLLTAAQRTQVASHYLKS